MDNRFVSNLEELTRHALRGPGPTLFTTLLTVGICGPFVFSGLTKLFRPVGAIAEVAKLGLPFPVAMAWLTIALQLLGSGAAILGSGGTAALGALALAGFTLLATCLAHAFWRSSGSLRAEQANLFMEHLSIVCALVFIAWWKWASKGMP